MCFLMSSNGCCHVSRIHNHMANDVTSVNTITHPSGMSLITIENWGIDFTGPISPTSSKIVRKSLQVVIARLG